jgi:hypothetical protein
MTTFGTPLIVSATSTPLLSIAELSDTLLICVYEVTGNLKARTITVSGTSLSNNTEVNVDTVGTVQQAVVVAISATAAILVHADNTSDTKARMLTVSGTTITVQSPTDVVNSSYFDLAKISSTTALWCYELSGDVTAAVLSVSGTTVSVGTPQVIDTTTTASVKCTVYSSTKSICTWNNTTASSEGAIVNLSGTTVSPQTPKTIKTRTTDTGEYATFCLGLSSTKAIHGHSGAVDSYLNVLTLNGNTFDIGTEKTIVLKDYAAMHAGKLLDTRFIMLGESAGVMDAIEYYLSGVSLDELTQDGAAGIGATAGGPIWGCPIDGTHICAMYGGSAKAAVVTSTATASHIWLSTDAAATFTNIGDSSWGASLVGAVAVIPGTAYQTIYAAVGTDLYKTTNGGTSWSLETAVGYQVDSIDIEKDNATIILANRASGGNRASLWDGAVLTHINTGKTTTGGATAISDVV